MGLPVVVTRNAWTMPQERWNTDWVRELGVGVVCGSFRTVREAIAQTISRLPVLQLNVGRVHNRAVFEVPEILEKLLAEAQGTNLPCPSSDLYHA